MSCVVKQPDPEKFEPFDFITESLDQTRGWFYTLNVLSTALYNQPAFKNVKVSGLILASDGKKMSKRLQNYTDPMELIDKYNSDVLRLYLVSSPASKGESFNFNDDDIMKLFKKFTPLESGIKMFNNYSVMVETDYMIKNFSSLDCYIIEMINKFNQMITNKLNLYDTSNMDDNIIHMIDVICNVYIRLSRDRMNHNLGSIEYNTCYKVLDYVLNTFISSIYPVMPGLYSKWKTMKKFVNYITEIKLPKASNVNFEKVINLIELGRKFRDYSKMRITLPLKKLTLYLPVKDIKMMETSSNYIINELNLEELNFKDINTLPGKFKPIVGKVGRVFKRETKNICKLISSAKSTDELEKLGVDSSMYIKEIEINDSEEIKYMKDFDRVIEGNIMIDEDTIMKENLTLLKKKINSVKKEMGLNWFDNVSLGLKKNSTLENYRDYLKKLHLKYQLYDDEVKAIKFKEWDFVISTTT